MPTNHELSAARRSGHWGFRFFRTDIGVLVGLAGLTVWFLRAAPELVWLPPLVGGHFFLFCNVVRLCRRLELLWAAVFVLNVAGWAARGDLRLLPVLLGQLPVTVVLVAWEIRQPRYHGVWADRLNPRLGDYLRSRSRPGEPDPSRA
jgi:hypothetical protein